MYGSNVGRALMSAGTDVLTWSIEQQRARREEFIAQMKDSRERDLAELRAAVQQLRAGGGGARGAGGGEPTDLEASIYAVDRQQRGPGEFQRDANPVAMDDDGNPMPPAMVNDDAAYQQYRRQQQRGYEDLQAARKPGDRDSYARGRIEQDAFEAGFNDVAGGRNTERARQAVRASQGKDRFKVDEGVMIDEAVTEGFVGETRSAEARTQANEQLAALRRRTDPNRTRSGGAPTDVRDANTAVETARRALNDATRAGLDALLRQNAQAMSMPPDERQAWIARQPRVEAAARDLDSAQANRQRLLERGQQGTGSGGALPAGVTRETVIQQAREAIRRGADRGRVVERLRGYGMQERDL